MRIQTPFKFHRFAYFGLDTRARSGDELLAAGLGRFYLGLYPTEHGVEVCWGKVDENGSL